jgi:hypothetical protein
MPIGRQFLMTMRRAVHKAGAMDENMQSIILGVVERAPQWVRRDLEAKDAGVRARAEETLAAMITSALKAGTAPAAQTAASMPN